jgi:hypothetical protein
VTAAVKQLALQCPGQPLQRRTVTLPHSVAVQDSTSATFPVTRGRCTITLEEGFNMSALQHFAHYTGGKGGRDGVLNQAQVQALTVAPVAPQRAHDESSGQAAAVVLADLEHVFRLLGIQFGFALQNANASRIFETLGADMDAVPGLWIAAPLTGLLVQPVIGYLSDRTWTRWGRRRPFFMIGAVLTTLALLVMPNSPTLWIAAGTLWVLDASINVSMEPFRASSATSWRRASARRLRDAELLHRRGRHRRQLPALHLGPLRGRQYGRRR